jgi:hypothetical protein
MNKLYHNSTKNATNCQKNSPVLYFSKSEKFFFKINKLFLKTCVHLSYFMCYNRIKYKQMFAYLGKSWQYLLDK